MSSDIDNKVVSISFNNKQFLKDVEDTISVIEDLNKATSGKNIDTSGIENLSKAFRNATGSLTNDAGSVTKSLEAIQSASNINFQTGGIDSLRKALENTGMTAVDVEDTITSLQQLSRTGLAYASDLGVSNLSSEIQNESANTRDSIIQDLDDVQDHFSALELIAMGVCLSIGNKVVELGQNAFSSLTAGIRDGWAEYNALTNSTQTILVNTQRWGSTMADVSSSLEELNRYADMTTYSFSDMTRNIGYFTTAGVNLEDSVTAIQGLSNVGAMFGADAASVARAGYQISQAMSAGVIKLMDWRSMINAGMGGQALQDELIRTAAVMSGTSVDAMNDYIESLGGFNASLQEGWLTSDIFLEAMRKFAGQTREYYESLTDENGNRLYDDDEIDRLVRLGESATESATQVRTLQQMIDAFKESIGSGWQRTFTMIIGNLEEAKEFWTPINNILTSLVDRFFDLQTGALELWRSWGGREELLEGIQNTLAGISGLLSAIGAGFSAAFGGDIRIGSRLAGITEAITDFSERLILSEEELGYLKDFFEGLFEPISLVVDIIFELIKAFFDAGDGMSNAEKTADSFYDTFSRFRTALLATLGYFGSVIKAGADFIRNNEIIKKTVQVLAKVISKAFNIVTKVIAAPFILLYQIWERYNISEKLDEFAMKAATFFLPIVDAITEVKTVFENWFDIFTRSMDGILESIDPIETIVEVFTAIKQLFIDLFDPTLTIKDAFNNFINTLSGGNIGALFDTIKMALNGLWEQIKDTTIGQWFMDLKDKIQNAWEFFKETPFGQWLGDIISSIKDFIGLDTGAWDEFWDTVSLIGGQLADDISTGWQKIKEFFVELADIVKAWFGISTDAEEASDSINESLGAVGGGIIEGELGSMPGVHGLAMAMTELGDAANYAEEKIPDPSNSRFLAFLRDFPQQIRDFFSLTSDDSILTRISKFLHGIIDPIVEFFNDRVLGNEGNSITDWLRDKVDSLLEIISNLLGIETIKLGDTGFLGVIGQIISAIINGFAGIDKGALNSVESIARTVVKVLANLAALKLASAIENFSKGVKYAGKGWADKQAAAKLSAMASVLMAIAVAIIGIGAVVAFLSYGIKNGMINPWTVLAVFSGVLLMISFLYDGMTTLAKQAEKVKPGSFTGIVKILKQSAALILSIVVALAAIIGIAYVIHKIMDSNDDAGKESFGAALAFVTVIFVALAAGMIFMISQMSAWADRLKDANGAEALSAVSDVLHMASSSLISIAILLGGVIAAIVACTYFLAKVNEKGLEKEFWGAVLMVGVILAVATIAVDSLIDTAKQMAAGVGGVKPSDFKQIMMLMTGLLVTIVASVTILLIAVTMLVNLMNGTGATIWQFMAAAGIISLLIVALSSGLSAIFSSMNKIAGKKMAKVWQVFGMLIGLLVVLGGGVYLLMEAASEIANNTSSLVNLEGTVLAFVIMFTTVIASLGIVISMVSQIDLRKVSNKRLKTILPFLAKIAGGILVAMVAIMGSFAGLTAAMGASGFTAGGGSILAVGATVAAMLLLVSFIAKKIIEFAPTIGAIDWQSMAKLGIAFGIAVGGLLGISGALAILVGAMGNGTHLLMAAVILGALFAALGIALNYMAQIATFNTRSMVTAAACVTGMSISFIAIAGALMMLANIDTSKLWVAFGVLSLLTIIGAGVLTGLTFLAALVPGGGVALIIAASAMVAFGLSLVALASSMLIAAAAFDKFGDSLSKIEKIDGKKIRKNLSEIAKAIPDSIKIIAGGIIAAQEVIVGAGITLATAIATAIFTAINVFNTLIAGNIAAIISGIASIFIGIIDGILISVRDYMATLIAPGSVLWQILDIFGEFAPLAAEYLGYYGFIIAVKFMEGIVHGMQDMGWDLKLIEVVNHIWTAVKQRINEAFTWLEERMNDFYAGAATMLSDSRISGYQEQLDAINDEIHSIHFSGVVENDIDRLTRLRELQEARADIIANMEREQADRDAIIGYHDSEEARMEDELDNQNAQLDSIADTVDDMLAQEAAIRGIYDNAPDLSSRTGYSTYMPDQYRGMGMDVRREATQASSGLSLLGNALSSIFGGDGGQSLGDTIRGFLGLSEGESIGSTLMSALGLGDLGSMFSGAGASSGTNFLGGFQTSLDTGAINLNMDGWMPDELSNPVITPVVDTSEYSLGLDNMEDIWNSHNFDEFAVDAGTSMTLRESAEGDAATSGAVTYNYTQYNSSPEALSPIQIYRDTQNLLRGRVNS